MNPLAPLNETLPPDTRRECREALVTTDALRAFMSERTPSPLARIVPDAGAELLLQYMVKTEVARKSPRRSILKTLHLRYNQLRLHREWWAIDTELKVKADD